MTAQYEIREDSTNRYYPFQVIDLETGKTLDTFPTREAAQQHIDELVDMLSDFSVQVAIYGDDPANEKPLPTEEAPKAVEEMPESIIIDGQNEAGTTIEYKGQQWMVTSSGFYSERDQRTDENGGMGSLTIGWHSWLRKV